MAEIMQERLKIKTTIIQYVRTMFYHCRLRFHVCNVEDLDTLYCNNNNYYNNNCSWSKQNKVTSHKKYKQRRKYWTLPIYLTRSIFI